MYPHLCTVAGRPISTYGVLFVTGLFSAVLVAGRLARQDRLDENRIFLISWLAIFAAMLGARLMHVCTQLPYYWAHPQDILRIWDGWAFLGGPLAAFVVVLGGAWYFRLPVWRILDAFTVALALGLMFGRIGCLFGGCCHGKPTGCDFGIRLYADTVLPSLRGVPLHPTQLYEAAGALVLFGWLLRVFHRRAFVGQVFLLFFLVYPALRFLIEFVRGDVRGSVFQGPLSTSQFVSILIFVPAALAYRIRSKGGFQYSPCPQPTPEAPVRASAEPVRS